MIAQISQIKPQDDVVKTVKALSEKLLELDIHGECYVQITGEWLFMGYLPPGWSEYAVSCCVPKKPGHRARIDAFIHLVREWDFIWTEGGND